MQETNISEVKTNVFIDFQIILQSEINKLSKELDVLLAGGKKIYLWSKTASVQEMKEYCKHIRTPVDKKTKKLHQKSFLMRHQDKKTLADIAKKLDLTLSQVSYFIHNNPLHEWVLDDWIESYLYKDSSLYSKVDYLVDCNKKLVDKFKKAGREATLIERL